MLEEQETLTLDEIRQLKGYDKYEALYKYRQHREEERLNSRKEYNNERQRDFQMRRRLKMEETQIVTKISKQELIADLLVLPESINTISNKLYDQRKHNDEVLLQIKNIENKLYMDVDSEVDSSGKKIYSNDLKRKAELDNRLKNHANHQSYVLQQESLKENIDNMQLALEFLNNRFKAVRAISLLVGDDK
jgi:hypothetical protein